MWQFLVLASFVPIAFLVLHVIERKEQREAVRSVLKGNGKQVAVKRTNGLIDVISIEK